MAVESEVLSAVMQRASFGYNGIPQNSNFNDYDIKRQVPEFAARAGRSNTAEFEKNTEKLPVKKRNELKAVKDPVLAKRPDVKPLFHGSKDYEPIDHSKKVFKSPVFLVDPKFTEELEEEEQTCFRDNDFGGWRVPVNPSRWPYVRFEVQDYFKVGPNCSCTGSKEIHHVHP